MAKDKIFEKSFGDNGEDEGTQRPTQAASRGERPIVRPDPATAFVGQSINQQGNMLAFKRREPGRIWRRIKDAGRPEGFSTARFSTGVNPEEPINDSPYWPRG